MSPRIAQAGQAVAVTRAARCLGLALALLSGGAAAVACQAPALRSLQWGKAPAWLTCFDQCARYLHELDVAVGLAPDSMLGFLQSAMIGGPGAATMQDYEQSLRRMHRADSVLLAQGHRLVMRPESLYVAEYLRRLDATWRVRAALGLGYIAFVYRSRPGAIDDTARAMLVRASQTALPSPVSRAVLHGLDTLYVRDSLPH